MDGQLEADLLSELALLAIALGAFKLGEQFLHLAVIRLQKRDRIGFV
ncbi:hypothetical protein LRS10_23690 [Phenylobacterium sp. J426]|nr:hypothetical protein [Phenylobacterium sp. J426]MCR5876893.1 hypothetical protein [Phenylobacterium sp. J426]